jgi:hypothetical protein
MGVSMWSRQVDSATTSKFNETFRVCRAFYADHFGKKVFEIEPIFYRDTGKILFRLFALFAKNKKRFFRKVDDNSSLVTQILKPIRYSDSSWKSPSKSIETWKILSNFWWVLWFTVGCIDSKSVPKVVPEK